jgi:membrane fusion protein (multidrug efflux system)
VSRAALALVLLLPLLAACGKSEDKSPKTSASAVATPLAVASAVAKERTHPRTLEVTGTLVADAQADVAAETSGRVIAVAIERGTHLPAGTVIARLDDRDASNQLREAEAAEAQAAAKIGLVSGRPFNATDNVEVKKVQLAMERLEKEYERYARLVDEGAVSRSEADSRRVEYLTAKEEYAASLQRAREAYQGLLTQRVRVQIARKGLEDVIIRAPFEGLVAEKYVSVGQFLQKGARVATLVRVDPLRIELTVPEIATAAVKRAENVRFVVQAYPDRAFEGRIKYIGPSLRSDSRALVVEAVVPNRERLLHPGFFATARIDLPATEPSLFVPAASVRTDAGVSKVFVLKDGRAEQRFVQIGRGIGGEVEVLRGLRNSERVATSDLDRLADGLAVTERGP